MENRKSTTSSVERRVYSTTSLGLKRRGLQCVEYGTERSKLSLRIVSAVRVTTLTNSGLAAHVSAYRNVDCESNLHFLFSYRGGQLVVEYATVGFRSQGGTVGQLDTSCLMER